jgi:hypothetical protein
LRASQTTSNRQEVVATVGYGLGYYSLVDGTKFTEGEIKREIEQVLKAADFLSQVAEVLPTLGLYGLLLTVAVKLANVTASIVAPMVLILLKKHEIKGAQVCGR